MSRPATSSHGWAWAAPAEGWRAGPAGGGGPAPPETEWELAAVRTRVSGQSRAGGRPAGQAGPAGRL